MTNKFEVTLSYETLADAIRGRIRYANAFSEEVRDDEYELLFWLRSLLGKDGELVRFYEDDDNSGRIVQFSINSVLYDVYD